MRKLSHHQGFTLFEMVIAVSIFAVMGVIAFGGLGQMTRSGQSVADANDRLSALQFAVVYFARDWMQVSPRKIRDRYGDEASNIVLEEDRITFTRGGRDNLLGLKRSHLQRVQYELVDHKLMRRYWASLDQAIGEEPLEVALLDNVDSLAVTMQDAKGEAITIWPDDGTLRAGQPVLLSFRLELKDLGEITRWLEIPDGGL